ncbi:hypothetical protein AXFE_12470 [Acidithrix ferrooxidans]|uniref:Uncharacterized protein n=1 Tax=Acidithrix ferrooxidans TaxID=1280514 RepID=A0A0D8HIV7_9ACTN|nr:hypothetical protein AXFE_12470 [Acidithrix ferrooxidans]
MGSFRHPIASQMAKAKSSYTIAVAIIARDGPQKPLGVRKTSHQQINLDQF